MDDLRRIWEHIGPYDWAAGQDWMCEDLIINGGTSRAGTFVGTHLSVAEHRRRTVQNFLELRSLAPELRIIPSLKGGTIPEYHACADLYESYGVDLRAEPTVGLGSVCRLQSTAQGAAIVTAMAARGYRLHGFGFKTLGLAKVGHLLASADSEAWSFHARKRPPMPGHTTHKNCANCLPYALRPALARPRPGRTAPADGSSRMTDTATLAGLDPTTLGDLLRVAGSPGLDRWMDQTRRNGGCADPIHLTGSTKNPRPHHRHGPAPLQHRPEPGGRLRLACGNRRASRCPACAWTYAGDTYHLIRAGLVGDTAKGTPDTVRDHPRVFATFTAPSFGPIHNRPTSGRCRCGTTHPEGAPELGTPLNPQEYDYASAVLWNNHALDLWRYVTIYLPRELAARVGITQRELRERLRISYGKVAEYQRRGAIHFHAVIRLDGPDGPDTPTPGLGHLRPAL
ncbi:replication initiator [Streptomyces sp. DSM 41534]